MYKLDMTAEDILNAIGEDFPIYRKSILQAQALENYQIQQGMNE